MSAPAASSPVTVRVARRLRPGRAADFEGDNATRVLTGMEGWFALPASDTKLPPPRHKMAVVTWLGIFPLVLIFSAVVGPLLSPIHPVLSVMVG